MKKTVLVGTLCFLAGMMACAVVGSLSGVITWHWRTTKTQSAEEAIREASLIYVVQKKGSEYRLKTLIWAENPTNPFSAAPFDALRIKKSEASLPAEVEILVFRMPAPKDWDHLLPMQWELPLEQGVVRQWKLSLEEILSLIQTMKNSFRSEVRQK